MSETPSQILARAADLVQYTAGHCAPGHWFVRRDSGLINICADDDTPVCTDAANNGHWIALTDPLVGELLAHWLLDAAGAAAEHEADDVDLCVRELRALAVAHALLRRPGGPVLPAATWPPERNPEDDT